MKKLTIAMVLVLSVVAGFAKSAKKPNYKGGNGTVIFERKNAETYEVLRKCEVDVVIGDLLKEDERNVYDGYKTKKSIGRVKDNDKVKVKEVYLVEYLKKEPNRFGKKSGELWYRIESDSLKGWICKYPDYVSIYPYEDNKWEILETVKGGGKTWTVRKMDYEGDVLSVWSEVELTTRPGFSEKDVVYTIKPGDTDPYQSSVHIIAMTEETEVYNVENGWRDHWLKVRYKDYVGWMFGKDATAERGGPRYFRPENIVLDGLGWYGMGNILLKYPQDVDLVTDKMLKKFSFPKSCVVIPNFLFEYPMPDEIAKQIEDADNGGKYVLRVGKYDFDYALCLAEGDDSRKKSEAEKKAFFENLKNSPAEKFDYDEGIGCDQNSWFSETKKINRNCWIETRFYIQVSNGESSFANPPGIYRTRVYLEKEKTVYDFIFDANPTGELRKNIMSNLSDYVTFKPGEKPDLSHGVVGTEGYYWNATDSDVFGVLSIEKFYNDMASHKKTLPPYVRDFQSSWENVYSQIVKVFK